jgi:DNA-binding response OmpR family regulator
MSPFSRLIIADADAKSASVLAFGFGRIGAMATTATTVDDAIKLAVENAGAVIVTTVAEGGLPMDVVTGVRDLSGPAGKLPVLVLGKPAMRQKARAAGANDFLVEPAFVRDVVTMARLLATRSDPTRDVLTGDLADHEGLFHLFRALSAAERTGVLTILRGIRRGELRFFDGEVTSAQCGALHGIAALHQLLLWGDGRFELRPESVVRRQQIPLSPAELIEDAGRFLRDFDEVAGDLSPGLIYEQDLKRVAEHVDKIPKEVGPVLRLFDGGRMLADVIEDSPFRVPETVKIAARLAELGAIKQAVSPRVRAGAQVALAVDDWRMGVTPALGVPALTGARESERIGPAPGTPASPPPVAAQQEGSSSAKKKKKTRAQRTADPAVRADAAPQQATIDWGKLPATTPVLDRDHGPAFAPVVPSQASSGEIAAQVRPSPDASLASAAVAVAFDLGKATDAAIRAADAEAQLTAMGSTEAVVSSDATPIDALPPVALAGSSGDQLAKVVEPEKVETPHTNGANGVAAEAKVEAPPPKIEEPPPKIEESPKIEEPPPKVEEAKVEEAKVEEAKVEAAPAPVPVPAPVPSEEPKPHVSGTIEAVAPPAPEVQTSVPSIVVAEEVAPPAPAAPEPPAPPLALPVGPPPALAAAAAQVTQATADVLRAAEHAFDEVDEEFFSQGHQIARPGTPPPVDNFDDLNDVVPEDAPPPNFWKRLFGRGTPTPAPVPPPRAAATPTPTPAPPASQPRKPQGGGGGHKGKHGKKRR